MSIPLPYADQYACRNETLEVYASDRRGQVAYQFNNFGYRNNIDYSAEEVNTGTYIGSSATAAIGIPWEQSFAYISSQALGVKCYQFSQGCVKVDNQEYLRLLTLLKAADVKSRYYVLQFIDLDRRYNHQTGNCETCDNSNENIELFMSTFRKIEQLLFNDVWCFVVLDAQKHQFPDYVQNHPRCLGINIPFIDRSGVGEHPGVKWHNMIAQGIQHKLKKQLS